MQISGPITSLAPLATGHPVGLPEPTPKTPPHKRVSEPVRAQTSTGFEQGKKPADFWRAATGQPNPQTHIAPPSLMQLRITQMLDDQVKAQQETAEVTDPASPENTAQSDGPEADEPEAPIMSSAELDKAAERQINAVKGYSAMERSSVFNTLP